MAIDNFIPQIWSAAVAEALLESATIAPICNRQYEGDARRGNVVHVTGVIPPNITDYKAAGRITNAQDLDDSGADILINQEKAFDFNVDDVDRVQAAGSFVEWTNAAGRRLGEDADAYIATRAVVEGTVMPSTPTDQVTDALTAHNKVRDMRKALNKAKVPKSDRFLVLNSEFEAHFLASDAKITSVQDSGTPAGLREAIIGRYLGFTIVSSEMLPIVARVQGIAFWRPALAYVSQIDETETMRSHNKFADRVRGLHVYGAKVLTMYQVAVQTFTNAP